MEYFDLDSQNDDFNSGESFNGRVNAISKVTDYNFDKAVDKATEHQINIISRNLNCTEVSKVYFSMDNINLLQTGIRNRILNDTGGEINIGRQKDDELKIVMRSIYFQYGKNTKNDVKLQVLDLNTRVIDWCVPEIMSNIQQSDKYIMDISTLPMPLDRPDLTTQKGLRYLEMTKL
jgi:hypothetical protein